MDGCFSLKKYDRHAKTINHPWLKGSIFIDPPALYQHDITPPATGNCSEFRSGDSKRKDSEFCDISGTFGVTCNHGIVVMLMSISKGESLAYSIRSSLFVRSLAPCNIIVSE